MAKLVEQEKIHDVKKPQLVSGHPTAQVLNIVSKSRGTTTLDTFLLLATFSKPRWKSNISLNKKVFNDDIKRKAKKGEIFKVFIEVS